MRGIHLEAPVPPERWHRIEELYLAARDRQPGDRTEFLSSVCGADEELKREVQNVLDQDFSPTA